MDAGWEEMMIAMSNKYCSGHHKASDSHERNLMPTETCVIYWQDRHPTDQKSIDDQLSWIAGIFKKRSQRVLTKLEIEVLFVKWRLQPTLTPLLSFIMETAPCVLGTSSLQV